MILPDLQLISRRWERSAFSGIDHANNVLDKKHFASYPHAVDYQYNSRGFRDAEWPSDLAQLQQAVWCVGDSFTAGVGAPFAHIWPQVLQQRLGRRTINVSMDGASNEWIARRTRDIAQQVVPSAIVIHWSYEHRREAALQDALKTLQPDADLSTFDLDCLRRIYHHHNANPADDIANIRLCIDRVTELTVPVIHSFIPPPRFTDIEFDFKSQLSVPRFHQLDRARDGHHYDILTAEWFVDQLMPLLQQLKVA